MATTLRSYRATDADHALLKRCAKRLGVSQSAFLRQAIATLARAYGVKAPPGATPPVPIVGAAIMTAEK